MWLLMLAMTAAAQMVEPVKTSAEMKMLNDTEAELLFHMTIADGWHVYSPKVTGGPIAATFNAEKMTGAKTKGALTWRGKEISKYDNMFQQEVQYFENSVTFVQKVQLTGGAYDIDCYVEYGACNDQMCLPPSEAPLKAKGEAPTPKEEKEEAAPAKEAETTVPTDTTTATDAIATADSAAVINASDSTVSNLWTPVINELRAKGSQDNVTDHSLLYILLMGFVGGLLAVCMPCIWPIIPMTVSFFLKRAKADKRKGIRDALTYGISIIVIYLALGLIVTAFFGSDMLNALSTNAVFNIFLFLLLVVFALSFFGWFELKLPDSWTNKVDQKSEKLSTLNSQLSTFLSIFLMAFTLVLVSFSCTAPIVGLLLVETATSGNWLAPATGMFGFALALALPFALYMVPGLWGAPCKVISAFAPPMNTQDFNLNTKTVEARFTDYEAGMAAAQAEGKPVLIDFTGFGCVNCRKMEAAVWTDPRVADKLTKDFVLISLYVDDKTPLQEPMEVTDAQGNTKKLRTVGAKWSYLQSTKFGANAQPFYVILDSNGKPLSGSRAYDEDVEEYLKWLKSIEQKGVRGS